MKKLPKATISCCTRHTISRLLLLFAAVFLVNAQLVHVLAHLFGADRRLASVVAVADKFAVISACLRRVVGALRAR